MDPIDKPVIGWREWLALPDIGVPGVKAKIDTGARSSALHTHDFEVFEDGGKELVRFHLHPLKDNDRLELSCVAPLLEYREVRNSFGHTESRPFIRTTAVIGEFAFEIDLSLTNREEMKYRMLLGRQSVADRFLINPSESFQFGRDLSVCYEEAG